MSAELVWGLSIPIFDNWKRLWQMNGKGGHQLRLYKRECGHIQTEWMQANSLQMIHSQIVTGKQDASKTSR